MTNGTSVASCVLHERMWSRGFARADKLLQRLEKRSLRQGSAILPGKL